MPRNFSDWLAVYEEHCRPTEPPPQYHFWSGVATIAGCLRRHVWLDQRTFKWYPNHYVVLVGPAGIKKTTACDLGMGLLKQVPGIRFGANATSWQKLTKAIAEVREEFEYPIGSGDHIIQSALMLSSGELGNLLDPQDSKAIDLFVRMWEAKDDVFVKETKHCGNDEIVNECVNLLGATTPAWIAGNMPEYVLGGGFMSRCVFVYGDKPANEVAYPDEAVHPDYVEIRRRLAEDLVQIAQLRGPYRLTPEARAFGREWYSLWHQDLRDNPPDDRVSNYNARKQTHLHKLSMVIAASRRDELVITVEDIASAVLKLNEIEPYMKEVVAEVGRTEESRWTERLLQYVRRHGVVPQLEAYQHVHSFFTSRRRFDDIVQGLIESGLVELQLMPGGKRYLVNPRTADERRSAAPKQASSGS